jgi:hypothetical protein
MGKRKYQIKTAEHHFVVELIFTDTVCDMMEWTGRRNPGEEGGMERGFCGKGMRFRVRHCLTFRSSAVFI